MAPRSFQHPARKDIRLDAVLYALSDPIRREIVQLLAGCEAMRCNQSCDVIAPSTLSFHFRVLRESGLVKSHRQGVEVQNTLRKNDIDKKFPGLLGSVLAHHTKPKLPAGKAKPAKKPLSKTKRKP
jgi:DNA-binding transcriptional ArsR family regulator